MTKKKFFSMVLTVVLILCLVLPPTEVRANDLNDIYFQCDIAGLMAGGYTPHLTTSPVYGLPVYISSLTSFSSYVPYILDSISAWNSPTYDISLVRTTQYASSVFDIKGASVSDPDDNHYYSYGYCTIYCGSGAYGYNNIGYENYSLIPSNYWLVEIYINKSLLPVSMLGTTRGEYIMHHAVAHELGHAMGLGHRMSTYNLMYAFTASDTVYYTNIPNVPSNTTDKSYVKTLYDFYDNEYD